MQPMSNDEGKLTTVLFTTLPALKKALRGCKRFQVEVAGEKSVTTVKISRAEAIHLMANTCHDFVMYIYTKGEWMETTVHSANGEYGNEDSSTSNDEASEE
jgi:hypothetical protein